MAWTIKPSVTFVTLLVLANLHNTVRAADQSVSPVAKVIDLLTTLLKEVEDEGKMEAATYEKFSCFCKESTASKSSEVTKSADKIDELSASIEAKSAEKKEKQEDVTERKGKHETMSVELDDEKARCSKEEQTYDAKSVELTKAIAGIRDAKKSLKAAKNGGASLLDLSGPARENVELAEAIELAKAQVSARRDSTAFLQVDPEDPEYNFHSGNIISVLEMLEKDYGKTKTEVDTEWKKTDAACKATKEALKADLKNNKDAMSKLEEKIEALAKDVAQAKEDLVSEQTALQDAEVYLKDVKLRCEARAKDWDQRTAARKDEVEALTAALGILEGTVKEADEVANKRALLLSARKSVAAKAVSARSSQEQPTSHIAVKTALTSTEVTTDDASDSQEIATELTALESADTEDKSSADLPSGDNSDDVTAWLHGGAPSFLQTRKASTTSSEQRHHDQVLAFVQQEARRLDSTALNTLAVRVASDPFSKVKGLIQQLLERLLEESAGEATKKGFCDEQLGKVSQARDYNFEDAQKLNAEIRALEARKKSLDTEVDEAHDHIDGLVKEFDEAKKLREQEKKDNLVVLDKAKEGLEAVTEAYNILKAFYSKAGSAAMLQASPVDEDAPDAVEGEYKGKQGASKSILGLLQVIVSDFERTLRTTSEAEKKAAAEFEDMKQTSEADHAAKETKRDLSMQDSKTTESTIRKKMKDMKYAMDVVDSNLKTLQDLKPTCQESGRMSFKERTEKREQEMAALKKAMCKLDTEGVEGECK